MTYVKKLPQIKVLVCQCQGFQGSDKIINFSKFFCLFVAFLRSIGTVLYVNRLDEY
jgi:hypothetical protein